MRWYDYCIVIGAGMMAGSLCVMLKLPVWPVLVLAFWGAVLYALKKQA